MRTRSKAKKLIDLNNDEEPATEKQTPAKQTPAKQTKVKYDGKSLVSKKTQNLAQFNMSKGIQSLTHHPMCLLIGQRHSGKNILMNELIYELDRKFKYDHIFLFSATGAMNYKETWSFMREATIYDKLDKLKEIIKIRKESMSKSPVLLIFDDIAGMTSMGANGKRKNVKYNEELDFLSTTARHFSFTCIVSIQNRVLCSRTLRTNCSLSFLSPAKSNDDCKTIRNEYLGLCKSNAEAQAIYDSVYSKPFNTLVVEGYKSGVITIQDYVSQYVAPFPIRKWKAKSLKKIKSAQNKKRKDDLKIEEEERKKNTLGLSFRISIYSDELLRKEQANPENEKAINIYGE